MAKILAMKTLVAIIINTTNSSKRCNILTKQRIKSLSSSFNLKPHNGEAQVDAKTKADVTEDGNSNEDASNDDEGPTDRTEDLPEVPSY